MSRCYTCGFPLRADKSCPNCRGSLLRKGAKVMLIIPVLMTLVGCSTFESQLKRATDEFCDLSPANKAAIADKFDPITYPNQIRIVCAESKK